MVEKHSSGGCEFDAADASLQKLNANLCLQIAHLPAQEGLGGVQFLAGCHGEASGFRYGDEIFEMPQFHLLMPRLKSIVSRLGQCGIGHNRGARRKQSILRMGDMEDMLVS
jgi:hypothetical protein